MFDILIEPLIFKTLLQKLYTSCFKTKIIKNGKKRLGGLSYNVIFLNVK